MTLVAATVLVAAAVVALPLPAQANWHPWTNLGGETLYGAPGFHARGWVFARNGAAKLVMRERRNDGSWSDWSQIVEQPEMVDGPSPVEGYPPQWPVIDSFEVYYRTSNNDVAYAVYKVMCKTMGCSGGFGGVVGIAGPVASAPAAVKLSPDRTDVFARGMNNQLLHTWRWGGPWARWEELGGLAFVESPSAVSWWGGNRLDVFVKGANTHLWHRWWTSTQGWTGWEDLGGVLTSAPAVIRFDDSRLDVFAKGTSDSLIHRWWDATTGWSAWEDLGGRFQYGPSVVKALGPHIDVFVTGSTAQLEHIWWG